MLSTLKLISRLIAEDYSDKKEVELELPYKFTPIMNESEEVELDVPWNPPEKLTLPEGRSHKSKLWNAVPVKWITVPTRRKAVEVRWKYEK